MATVLFVTKKEDVTYGTDLKMDHLFGNDSAGLFVSYTVDYTTVPRTCS
jgi:hypothetical protein